MRTRHVFSAGAATASVALAALLGAGCYQGHPSTTVRPAAPQNAASPQVVSGDTIQQGTRILAQLDAPIGVKHAQAGQPFTATVVQPVVDAEGIPIIPVGSRVTGHIESVANGTISEPGDVSLAIDSLEIANQEHPLAASIVATDVEAPSHGVNPNYVVAGGAGGAVLGAVLGRGLGGALVGGALGAGAGTLISMGNERSNQVLPQGTALAIQLDQPIPVVALRGEVPAG
jgi:hypothetical protein